MNALQEIKNRFRTVLDSMVDDSSELLTMIRPAKGSGFGDYQVNCAMPLKNRLGKAPREIATDMIDQVQIDDLCQHVEVAGPGFINLTLDDTWLRSRLLSAFSDPRLGVAETSAPKTFVVDFSSPNVAKPMHVGHIRSTVIGDAVARILKFMGHHVITDNHLGDWGTQFGMIIYGYKHFLDAAAFDSGAIDELGRLYKFVRRLIDYHESLAKRPEAETLLQKQKAALDKLKAYTSEGNAKADKKNKKDIQALTQKIDDQNKTLEGLQAKINSIDADANLKATADQHADIGCQVLAETALLHEGDAQNRKLWDQFLPICRADIQRIYDRLDITFDHELGESFYHEELAGIVDEFSTTELACGSEGAVCIFLEEFDTPLLIQKKDGAFLYATTDLATLRYRIDQWKADSILYVVDHRQHEHFDKLFAAAAKWGYQNTQLQHLAFGTVLGEDGKPYQTRSGDTVGLEGLLDQAESRAREMAAELNPDLSDEALDTIATVVGIGGLKYVDLSQNRSSDYKFSYDKMLALKGNTATYLQYGYARVQGIIRRGEIDIQALRKNPSPFVFEEDVERKLALELSRFGEALDEVLIEFKPNLLAMYLFELTQVFFQFFDQCSVLKAEDPAIKTSRLQLCDLMARIIRAGLSMLGIRVVDQM